MIGREDHDGELDLTVRPVRLEDARDLYDAARHPAVARRLLLLPSMELAETQSYIENEVPGRHYLVAVAGGADADGSIGDRVVGAVTLKQRQNPRMAHSGSLGLMVHPDYWGRGVGTRLMAAVLDVADNWLHLHRVDLEVYTDNAAAIHLYRKFGFEEEGVRRYAACRADGWMDELVMARLHNAEQLPAPAGPPPAAERQPERQPLPEKLVVRPAFPDDLESYYELLRHPAVARGTAQIPTQEIGRVRKRLLSMPSNGHRFVADVNGRIAGSVNIFQHENPRERHAAHLGIAVHPDFWGQGVGSTLMHAALDLADEWLCLKRVALEVYVDNAVAVRLYKKFGFEIEGRHRYHAYGDGRWTDSYFMARLHL